VPTNIALSKTVRFWAATGESMAKQTYEMTQRALLALMDDMRDAKETAARINAQILALAEHHGVKPNPRG
jgi:hypothetical protein